MAWGWGAFQSLPGFCFSWIRSDGATAHPHASIGSPRVLVYTSPPLLSQCNEIAHQTHCLIVYPLLVPNAETFNRGNSFASGFMPHSQHIIPAFCFNFTLGWNLNVQHRNFFLHYFFSHRPVSLCRIIFTIRLASGKFLLCWILEICQTVAPMMLISHVCMSYTRWKAWPLNKD